MKQTEKKYRRLFTELDTTTTTTTTTTTKTATTITFSGCFSKNLRIKIFIMPLALLKHKKGYFSPLLLL